MDEAQAIQQLTVALSETTEGTWEAPVPNAAYLRHNHTSTLQNQRWQACLAIVVEGCKEIVLGNSLHALGPGSFTLTPVPLAVTGRIAKSPFTAIIVGLDPLLLSRIAADMDPRDDPSTPIGHALFQGSLSPDMWDAAVRLVGSFATPEAAGVLGPGYVRELLYHLLCGPSGSAIRQYVQAGSEAHRISMAVRQIESRLDEPLDINALAGTAHMSRTTFFEQFKRLTAHSPIQFQKRLRLLEAQHLMMEEQATAEAAAFRVGFASASQFSRDYRRMFGAPPLRHLAQLRQPT